MNRRQFLKSTAIIGAARAVVPGRVLAGKGGPNSKLNVALIGVWGRGVAHHETLSAENMVAICDVNEGHLSNTQLNEVSNGYCARCCSSS